MNMVRNYFFNVALSYMLERSLCNNNVYIIGVRIDDTRKATATETCHRGGASKISDGRLDETSWRRCFTIL